MEFNYYIFATYVFLLALFGVFIFKCFLSDTKKQREELDKREKNILSIYSTVEDMIEDLYDRTLEIKEELDKKSRELDKRHTVNLQSFVKKPEKQVHFDFIESLPVREEKEPDFAKVMETSVIKTDIKEPAREPARKEKILKLKSQGKRHAEIAQELKITQNEVGLIIDMYAKDK